MSKFKVGDRVRVLENSYDYEDKVGKTGTVVHTEDTEGKRGQWQLLVSYDLNVVPMGLSYDEYRHSDLWEEDDLDMWDDEQLELVLVEDDVVNNPSHYTQGSIETIDSIDVITDAYTGRLSYYVGACVKYIARANFKGSMLEDLKKAQWYLNRAVEYLEKKMEGNENE